MQRVGPVIAAAAMVLAAGCASGGTYAARPPASAPGADTTAPDGPGPYPVGRRTLQLVDPARAGRSLTVDLWYPAEAAGAAKAAPSKYVFVPGIEYASPVAKDAPPVAPGRFPVVVYSHGSAGIRFVSAFLTESLASHGFIVVAPDHKGNTALDVLLGAASDEATTKRERVADVAFVLTEVLAKGSGNPVGGSVDPQRVGVIGHSLGGFTALMTRAGWGATGRDARVRAIVGMAPYTRAVPADVLAAVDVPTLLITGTRDTVTPIELDTERPYELIPGRPLYRVDILDAAHQSFTDACAYQELLRTLPNVPPPFIRFVNENAAQGCGPGVLDPAQAQREINGYVTAFLEAYVAGNTSAAQYLVAHPPLTTVQVKS